MIPVSRVITINVLIIPNAASNSILIVFFVSMPPGPLVGVGIKKESVRAVPAARPTFRGSGMPVFVERADCRSLTQNMHTHELPTLTRL